MSSRGLPLPSGPPLELPGLASSPPVRDIAKSFHRAWSTLKIRPNVPCVIASMLVTTLGISPGWTATGPVFGTIVSAERASIGSGPVSLGATVFGGDRLLTDEAGSLQVLAGPARLMLLSASIAVLAKEQTSRAAILTRGTAIFSTTNSQAFTLHVGNMTIRPETDQPTIAQVSVVGPKQLLVRSTRGSLTVAVDDDVRVIPESMSYRIVLDWSEAELAAEQASVGPVQRPSEVGVRGKGRPPLKSGQNRFLWYAIGVAGIATGIVIWKAMESPSSPN
jgi:hypothetical protein